MKTKKCSRLAVLLIPMLLLAVSVLFAGSAGAQTLTAVAPIGDGSEDNPYWIETPENLMWMAEQAKTGNLCVDEDSQASTCSCKSCDEKHTHYFKLMNDLDFTGYDGFTAIAQSQFRDYYFHGTFDGNGHTIRGLRIDNWVRYNGVFGTVWDTVIKNVTFEDVSLGWTSDFSGIVAGYAVDSTFTGITVEGCRIEAQQYYSGAFEDRLGMICGHGENTEITDCTVIDPSITSVGLAGVVCGELVGGKISGVSVEGVDPYPNDNGYGAGIVSTLGGGTVENCTVCADLGLCSAGIVLNAIGEIEGGTITVSGCRVYKRTEESVQNTAENVIGGIVGNAVSYYYAFNPIRIENCFSEPDITVCAQEDLAVGGIVGNASGHITIVGCHAGMKISAADCGELSDASVGGIIGEVVDAESSVIRIENCSSGCTLPAAEYVGGFIGSLPMGAWQLTCENCFSRSVLPDVTGIGYVKGCGDFCGMNNGNLNVSVYEGFNEAGAKPEPIGVRSDPWFVGRDGIYTVEDIKAYIIRDTLYIEGSADGSGRLASYDDPADVPWYGYAGQIKKVVMIGYISHVGKNTFAALKDLDSFTIAGNSVVPYISASDLPDLSPEGKLYLPSEQLEAYKLENTYSGQEWGQISSKFASITVTRMRLGQEEIRVAPGRTARAKVIYEPQYASCDLNWSSSDEEVFTVGADGTITGVAEGTAVVTAVTSDGRFTSSCPVSVGCEEVTDGSLAITAVSLMLENRLTLTYKVKVGEGYENPRLNYRIRNAATGQDDIGTAESYTEADGELLFDISSIAPQRAGDNIRVELVAVRNGVPYCAVKDDYCILNYLSALTEYDSDAKDYDAALQRLIGDLIVYCSEVQKYSGYDPDHLIENRITPAVRSAAPTEIKAKYPVSKKDTGVESWKAQTMVLSDSIAFVARFEAENIDGLRVEVVLNGRKQNFSAKDLEYDEKTKRYTVIYEGVCASEFNDEILFTITTAEGNYNRAILSTSVNAYIVRNLIAEEPKATDGLLRALYNYGVSAAAYAVSRVN